MRLEDRYSKNEVKQKRTSGRYPLIGRDCLLFTGILTFASDTWYLEIPFVYQRSTKHTSVQVFRTARAHFLFGKSEEEACECFEDGGAETASYLVTAGPENLQTDCTVWICSHA